MKDKIMEDGIRIIIRKGGMIRWDVRITEEKNGYGLEEVMKYSLLSSPLATGKTPGEVLDNFLKTETKVLEEAFGQLTAPKVD